MKVSVVISCYNEKDAIQKIFGAVGNAPLADREIIVEGTLVCRLVPMHRNFCGTASGISARNFSLNFWR
jgi:hypothetical protein